MPLVRIKPDLCHGAAGQHKAGDEYDASPAEMESFGDKFILLDDADESATTVIEQEIVDVLGGQLAVVDATPSARALANEHGISLELSALDGSGKDGRVTKADVDSLIQHLPHCHDVNGDAGALVAVAEIDATPPARQLAEEQGVSLELSAIVGSGKDGRITKADVEALLDSDEQWRITQASVESVLNGNAE